MWLDYLERYCGFDVIYPPQAHVPKHRLPAGSSVPGGTQELEEAGSGGDKVGARRSLEGCLTQAYSQPQTLLPNLLECEGF